MRVRRPEIGDRDIVRAPCGRDDSSPSPTTPPTLPGIFLTPSLIRSRVPSTGRPVEWLRDRAYRADNALTPASGFYLPRTARPRSRRHTGTRWSRQTGTCSRHGTRSRASLGREGELDRTAGTSSSGGGLAGPMLPLRERDRVQRHCVAQRPGAGQRRQADRGGLGQLSLLL